MKEDQTYSCFILKPGRFSQETGGASGGRKFNNTLAGGSTKPMGIESFRKHSQKKPRQLFKALPRSITEFRRCINLLSTLRDMGWFYSAHKGAPVDFNKQPLPWFTYSAIVWLEPRLLSTDRVFEYGAGNSTLWFSKLVSRVESVENNPAWADYLNSKKPSNVRIHAEKCQGTEFESSQNDPYVTSIKRSDSKPFDVVVIDGMARNTCVKFSIPFLSQDGILVFDNADRPQHWPAIEFLQKQGFNRLDFFGLTAGYGVFEVTSVFFKIGKRWLMSEHRPLHLGF